ncbi:FGGY family carbohydrate kinase [Jatrophihabitans fulvus]
MTGARFVLAVDQGTTSTRAILFDQSAHVVSVGQYEHRQYFPQPGHVEHDAAEIWRNTQRAVETVLAESGAGASDIAALGIANQRETFVLWERASGRPVTRAISWQDTRSQQLAAELAAGPQAAEVAARSGLPMSAYFSAPRLRWLLDREPRIAARARAGELLFGTMESWLTWNLTGGVDGGVHVTDVTNASRTMLMDLRTLDWDPWLVEFFGVPPALLPAVRPSTATFGAARGPIDGVPVAAALGDQQAALFGQTAFDPGQAKCTLGTGSFVLLNVGTEAVLPVNGMLPTVAYQLPGERAVYAIEGSIAVTGALVQWFRDSLGMVETAAQIETLARSVDDTGGCYVVPAFSGLFAPHWQPSARGIIAGLTSYITRGHLARAVLEATAWQTKDVVDAMNAATSSPLTSLTVDGGMTSNNLLMQMIADVLDVPVVRSMTTETVSLGAAYAAGLSVGFWPDLQGLRRNWHRAAEWTPTMAATERQRRHADWKHAVGLSFDWIRD